VALCTQADVEAKIGRDITAEPEAVVTLLIAHAQGLIEGAVGRPLESDTHTDTLDGGQAVLILRAWPVTAVASVIEDGTTLTADTEYLWDDIGTLRRVGTTGYQKAWTALKPQSVVVEYTAGFEPGFSAYHDAALANLKNLCSEVVARAVLTNMTVGVLPAGAAGPAQSISLEGSDSVTFATGGSLAVTGEAGRFVYLTEDERRSLGAYR
jgi:hypothetical protein